MILALLATCLLATPDPAACVDPLVGTDSSRELSHGSVYPAIGRPWGMNVWTVQTGPTTGSGFSWIYKWRDGKIRGFRQTHQPSPWIGDYGTFAVMPVTGEAAFDEAARESPFSHAEETVSPFRCRVRLARYDTTVELTATERAAVLRLAYPFAVPAHLVVDAFAGGRIVEQDESAGRVSGYSVRRDVRWNELDDPGPVMANWFEIVCDRSCRIVETNESERCGAVISFGNAGSNPVCVRIASSFLSSRQARLNLAELGDGDFDRVAEEGRRAWNEVLGRFAVQGGNEDERRMFYTCLYRSLLFPRKFFELDETGEAWHRDPNTCRTVRGVQWCDTGFWDTFRALFPLLRLAYSETGDSFLKGLEATCDATGWLPEWSAPGFRHCMLGNHSASVVADAYFTGAPTNVVDFAKLYAALLHGANAVHPHNPHVGRLGWEQYNGKGYVSCDAGISQGVSRTLEYAYDDWCIARLGEALGRPKAETDLYRRRSENWRKVFDARRGWMNGRRADGAFRADFSPYRWGVDFTEGCTLHWTWSVFHDIPGLIEAMGGRASFVARLESLFSLPPISDRAGEGVYYAHENREMEIAGFGQYAHGNQPIQHALYLFALAGAPDRTRQWVDQVRRRLYRLVPDGYCGDEDNGQTSAWYVWSCLGMYPVCPASGEYVLGSPAFPAVDVRCGDGRTLKIRRRAAIGEERGVVRLHGQALQKPTVGYADVCKGGELVFE